MNKGETGALIFQLLSLVALLLAITAAVATLEAFVLGLLLSMNPFTLYVPVFITNLVSGFVVAGVKRVFK